MPGATERELRRRLEELTDFVENASEGLHRVGPDGTILWANQAELDLLGYEAHEYIGHNITEFHHSRLGMPGMDGYEVARRMRGLPTLSNTVITALSGWGQQEDRKRSADAGFDHHLVKPPVLRDIQDLLARLDQ